MNRLEHRSALREECERQEIISMTKKRTVKSVTFVELEEKREQTGYAFGILIILSYVLVIVTFPLSLCFCLKVRMSMD